MSTPPLPSATRDQRRSQPGSDRPLGIFDSGMGGISVLHELRALLPEEDMLYVADNAHVPYGGKPPAFIQERSIAITRFLLSRGAKAIVVACNTATVSAIERLRTTFDLPFVGMEPAVKPAVAATRSGTVGVLATGVTLAGERFANLADRFGRGVELITQPCPGLVEQVEAGDLEGPETVALVRRYVEPLLERGADTLVLGCTHYPFLRAAIALVAGPDVTLIDTGAAVARQTARVLDAAGLRAPAGRRGSVQFFTSADPAEVGPVIECLWSAPVVVSRLPEEVPRS